MPQFRIQKFTSTPLRYVSEKELLDSSGLRRGQHFLTGLINRNFAKTLRGRYYKAEQAVKATIPQIRDLEIKLQGTNCIFFQVLERLPVAAVEVDNSVVLMDRDGMALEMRSELPAGVPVITGLNIRNITVGKPIEVALERELKRSLAMLSALVEADTAAAGELQLLPLLVEVRPSAKQRVVIKLRLPANGKILNLSCAQNDYLTKHFVWLRRVIAAGVFDDRVPGTLDLSGKYQIFKPLDEQQEIEKYNWDGVEILPPAPQPVEYVPEESEWSEEYYE
ncbi:MAG: hypothetical protein Q4P65_02900 [Eubacteriales bacterium]|nr:hypothetical protein [Eubacteriales bacterium]